MKRTGFHCVLLVLMLALLGVSPPMSVPSMAATTTPKPSILVTPIAVIPGATVVVKGSGYGATTQITISVQVKLANNSPQTVQATAKTDNKGAFRASLHVPNNAVGGKYTVTGKDSKGQTASAALQVAVLKPSVVVVPAMAVPGTPITVNGFGYSSGASITITLAGHALGTVTATASGQFKGTFTVPATLATDTYTLTAAEQNGGQSSISLQVFRHIATHFYFAALYTGAGYQESLLLVNTSEIKAQAQITYQQNSGAPKTKTITVAPHSRYTENVNNDLGAGVSASAVIAADVPIAAERMVFHKTDGAIDPGTTNPSNVWYFSNGNTSHFYDEFIAIQNPNKAPVQVTVHLYPTHSHPSEITHNMPAQSHMTMHINNYVHDAVGVVVTANAPVVASRTDYIHSGVSSKTGVTGPATHWYFASGQRSAGTGHWNRHWIGVINTAGKWSYLSLHAYSPDGEELGTVTKWLRPYAREGFLMNQIANQPDVAVAISTSQPSIAEQLTFLNYNHAQNTDSYGVTTPQKTVQFAAVATWPGQDNLLSIFNPNLVPIPVVVQFLNQHGGRTQQTYTIAPFAHNIIDVGRVASNSQLGLLVASNDPFVALDRQIIFNGNGAMTTIGTQP